MKQLYAPAAESTALFAFVGSPWGALGIYLLAVNLITFLVFGFDKWKAKRKVKNEAVRRVPEKTLFLLAAAGGSLGALLGMRAFHHKTLHKAFRFGIPAILALQIIIPAGLYVYVHFIR